MELLQRSTNFFKLLLERFFPRPLPYLPVPCSERGITPIPCNQCGSTEAGFLVEKTGYPIVQCSKCELVYAGLQLPTEQLLATYSPSYFQNIYRVWLEENEKDVRAHYLRLCGTTAAYAPKTKPFRLADLGCGSGFLLHTVREEYGWEVFGSEVNPDAVAYAHQRFGLSQDEVVEGDLYELDYPNNHFHAVILADIIEHVSDPKRLLKIANRMLVPGGAVFVSTPSIESRLFAEQKVDWQQLAPPEHIYYFSYPSLNRMLMSCGFKSRRRWYNSSDRDCLFCVATKVGDC